MLSMSSMFCILRSEKDVKTQTASTKKGTYVIVIGRREEDMDNTRDNFHIENDREKHGIPLGLGWEEKGKDIYWRPVWFKKFKISEKVRRAKRHRRARILYPCVRALGRWTWTWQAKVLRLRSCGKRHGVSLSYLVRQKWKGEKTAWYWDLWVFQKRGWVRV